MKTAEKKKELRDRAIGRWKESKEWGDEAQIKALVMTIESQLRTQGMSYRSVALVAMQMENLGLNGVPYSRKEQFTSDSRINTCWTISARSRPRASNG